MLENRDKCPGESTTILAFRTITEQPDMRKLFAQEAAEPVALTPAEFSTYYTDEIARWRKVARERNLAANN